jgi:hypothetical protein
MGSGSSDRQPPMVVVVPSEEDETGQSAVGAAIVERMKDR